MPPRPSQNLDQALLAAGVALFPKRGCAGLAVREVAESAGVNLGMFHYHFKTREAFLRALLQQVYEGMYSQLAYEGGHGDDALENLRGAVRFMGRFVRANRPFITRLMADMASGEPVALEFARANMPRHLGMVHALIVAAQKSGRLAPVPPVQVLGLVAGSIAMPILFGGAVAASGVLGEAGSRELEATLLSDAAIDQRIDLALGALAVPSPKAPKRRAAPRKSPRSKP